MDFEAINRAALSDYPAILHQWLPGGIVKSSEYVCGDLNGGSGRSFSVNIRTGLWKDFSVAGKGGGNPISLYAAINNIEYAEAGKRLSVQFGVGSTLQSQPSNPSTLQKPPLKIIQPAPEPAPESAFVHPQHGKAATKWTYLNAEGQTMGYVSRFNLSDGLKTYAPLVYTEKGWKWKGFNKPYSLYNLDKLAKYSKTAQIIIVEGEKCADALTKTIPGILTMTWPHGTQSVKYMDWKPLEGREIIIWPDRDRKKYQGKHEKAGQEMPYNEQPGTVAAYTAAAMLAGLGCTVKIINVSNMDVPDGWDSADAIADGWDKAKIIEWIKSNLQIYEPKPEEKTNVVKFEAPITTKTEARSTMQVKPKPDKKPAPVTDTNRMSFTEGNEWKRHLSWKDIDKPTQKSSHNARVFFQHHPAMKGVFWLNTFSMNIEMRKCPAWKKPNEFKAGMLQDHDVTEAKMWLERYAVTNGDLSSGITISISETYAVIGSVAAQNLYNPLQDWLNSLSWNNEPNIDSWLTKYLGVAKNDYTKSVGRKFLIGAVARALEPGCKMDTMLVLEGKQGAKKSTAIEVLFSKEYFTDQLDKLGSKDAAQQLLGKWGIEIAEMAALISADNKVSKAWLVSKEDRFRPPYGRAPIVQLRSCVFFGTINLEGTGYLTDATGGRRYWPIVCGEIDIEGLRAVREQLWAEAVVAYHLGEQWWLDEEEVKLAEGEQAERYEEEVWADDINRFIQRLDRVTTSDIMKQCLEIPKERQERKIEMRIAKHLTSIGWVKRRGYNAEKQKKYFYHRPANSGEQLNILDSEPV